MTHEDRLKRVQDAIEDLYSDQSVPEDQTYDDLLDIRADVDMKIIRLERL